MSDNRIDLGGSQSLSLPRNFSGLENSESSTDSSNQHLHNLRIRILEQLIVYIPELRTVNGVQAIPFMQVSFTLPIDAVGSVCYNRICKNILSCFTILYLFFKFSFLMYKSGFNRCFG